MQPDAARVEDTRGWLRVAAADLRRASLLLAADPPDVEGALFHCQQAVEKALEEALAEQTARLFRRIEYLSVLANIAPMLGLLGTVFGMVLCFRQVANTQGSAGAAQLAEGIYQALVTTVVGLIIAIPSLGAFAILRSRVDQFVAEAAYLAQHAFGSIKRKPRSGSFKTNAPATGGPVAPPMPPAPPEGGR